MTNKDYITITDSKVMVGGEPTTKYRGKNIQVVQWLPKHFKDLQDIVKQEYGITPIEMHVLSSETPGAHAEYGNPSATPGPYAWMRLVFSNELKAPWVFRFSFSEESECAAKCADACCSYYVQYEREFRSRLLGSVADTKKDEKTVVQVKSNAISQSDVSVVKVKPKIVGHSGNMTTMEIDFDNKKLQFQIDARQIMKLNSK